MAAPARPEDDASEDEPLSVSYATEFHVSEQLCESESRLMRRINRFVVYYFGAYLCNLDLEASRCPDESLPARPPPPPPPPEREVRFEMEAASDDSTRHASTRAKKRPGVLQQSTWKRQLRFGSIPQVLFACFWLAIVYLIVAAYYQYSYDFDLLRVRELERRQADGGGFASGTKIAAKQQVEVYKLRMNATGETLAWLGPDYSHMTILAGCFYTCIVLLSLFMQVPIYLYHRYQSPFDQSHIIRDLLDQGRENELSVRIVDVQVSKFLESWRVHRAALIALPDTPLGKWQADARLTIDDLGGTTSKQETATTTPKQLVGSDSSLEQSDDEMTEMVREMLACGALIPLYKLRSWIRHRTLLQFAHHVWLAIYTICFHIVFAGSFFSLAKSHGQPASAAGQSTALPLIQIACLVPLLVTLPSLIVHPPIGMMNVQEQIYYIWELRRMIKLCIVQNSQIVNRIREARRASGQLSSSSSKQDERRRTMNSNLVFVLLHYKIFVAQITPILVSIGVQFVTGLAVLFTVPIMVRLNIPYLHQLYEDRWTDASIRIFAILISASALVPILMLAWPVCHMVARCQTLYRNLNSLAAHIARVRSTTGCRDLYDEYAQKCLCKELSDPHRLLGQLTPRAGPITGTYITLMKALFWYGLLLISIMADNSYTGSANRWLMSSLFSDPLGVYGRIN